MNFQKFFICFLIIISIGNTVALSYFDSLKRNTICKLKECCNPAVIPYNLNNLSNDLNAKLFGQHIVVNQLNKAVYSHFQNIMESRKPLVMSFHGTTGEYFQIKREVMDQLTNDLISKVLAKTMCLKFWPTIYMKRE